MSSKLQIKFKAEGLAKVKRNMRKMMEKIPTESDKIFFAGCQEIARRSKRTYCPIEYGTLRSTIKAGRSEKKRKGKISKEYFVQAGGPATITKRSGAKRKRGFAKLKGGSSVNYAAVVHNDMRPKKWTKKGTGPKYIEIPAIVEAVKMQRAIMQIAEKK